MRRSSTVSGRTRGWADGGIPRPNGLFSERASLSRRSLDETISCQVTTETADYRRQQVSPTRAARALRRANAFVTAIQQGGETQ